jgi:carboxypeptidase Q
VTIRNTTGTDHLSFTHVGLPAFQFIQDPLDYFPVTHHTNVDTYEHAVPADLMQPSAVIASVVHQAPITQNDCHGGHRQHASPVTDRLA